MLKINFLASDISDATGGCKYDKQFFLLLCKKFPDQVNLLSDSVLLADKVTGINFIDYSISYEKHFDLITDCDILILNSRLYTRFILIFIKYKYKKYRCKIFVTHHHFNFMTHSGILRIVHRYLEMKLLKLSDGIITPNIYVVGLIKKYKFLKQRFFFLESKNLKNSKAECACTNNKRILFVGTVEKRKGLMYAIKAFAIFEKKHPDYVFNIIGAYSEQDKYYQKLKKIISKMKLESKIVFRGRVTDEEKSWYFTHSDVFLFPSLNEGFGLVLVEAMSYGVPVVAFNNTAMPYTVNNNNGKIVTNKSIKELEIALETLLTDPAEFQRCRKGAIDTYNNLPEPDTIDREYNDFFSMLNRI